MDLHEHFRFLLTEADDADMMDRLRQAPNKETVISILREFKKSSVGSGAYRVVYDLGDGKVMKVAKDSGGQAANGTEYDAAKCLGPNYAVHIFEIHPEALWLITEKVEKLDPEALYAVLEPEWPGKTIDWLPDILAANAKDLGNPHKGRIKMGDVHDALFNKNAWYTGLIQGIVKCRVPPGDLGLRNWGSRGGKPVLLDLGGDGY